jgi:F-type H+-transporting ATPase subunit gamma
MAANTRDIRRRIKSIKNTSQITKAMQMVAAAKMRKAQQAALAGRPYSELLHKVLASVGERSERSNPLLASRPVKKELILVISTDKGLCGALNTNLFRELGKYDAAKTTYVAAGRKGAQYLARSKQSMLADFAMKDAPTFAETKVISKYCMEQFLAGAVDKVSVAYTHFVSTLTQTPTIKTILPLSPEEVEGAVAPKPDTGGDYLYEPGAEEVLGALLPHYVHFQIYQMTLDSRASEHSARMIAMKNATDNAKQLIKDLTLEYNKVRQAAITTEILEIATAQMAMG